MSYETFTNSSFIQQGRADSFTTSTPGERKRVLAEILELGYYDELEARAKHAYDQREARLWEERRLSREWEAGDRTPTGVRGRGRHAAGRSSTRWAGCWPS